MARTTLGSRYKVSEDGGKTWVTCCRYSELRREEVEANGALDRAIRAKITPDEFAGILIDILRKAGSKAERKAAIAAAEALLVRLRPSRRLRHLLLIEAELARRGELACTDHNPFSGAARCPRCRARRQATL